tara:strand:- start:1551 stop:3035 length:1485 start_codon:yes stop_codon:yes gene_type:complete
MDYKHKDITLQEEAISKIVTGINKLCDAVKITMGPAGKTVILLDEITGKPYATKDGVSVARQIELQNPIEEFGNKLAKEAAIKTAELAGDGTTTATVLIQAFIKEGLEHLKNGGTYNELKRSYGNLIPLIIKKIKQNASPLTKKNVKAIATTSSNNDGPTAELITKAYKYSNIVMVEEGHTDEDEIEKVEGVVYPVTYMNKMFITREGTQSSKLEDPLVLIVDGKITSCENIRDILVHANEEKKGLVIIAEHIDTAPLELLAQNVEVGALDILPIKTPGVGKYRSEYIKDIAKFTTATPVRKLDKQIDIKVLGRLKFIESTISDTTLLPAEDVSYTEHIKNLSTLYAEGDLDEYSKNILGERIKNLNAKTSIIKVGGKSDIERKEKYDRIEDAVLAINAAKEEGIVTGGGVTLYSIANELVNEYTRMMSDYAVLTAIKAPFTVIQENGVDYADIISTDAVDPAKVTRCAVENAASIALTILGTQGVVLPRELWS